MKKFTAVIAAIMMITAAGCGKTVGNADPTLPVLSTSPAETSTSADASAGGTTTTSISEVTTSAPAYTVNDDGALLFGVPVSEQDDAVLIEAANKLYSAACTTEWRYTVGCPYEVDRAKTAQNSLGWDFYLITETGINSLADVRADYHKIFSESYPDAIDETFLESGGRAYCLCGERGNNIYFQRSEVVEVKSKSDSEIVFGVDSSYTDDGYGSGPYTAHDDFVVTVDSDDVWRVKEFKMPY